MVKVGLIGFGLSGRFFHAPLLKSLDSFEVVKVVSSRVNEVQSVFPLAQSCELSDVYKDVDLVVITSPHEFHFEQARAALENNCHVVVEKPFVATLEEAHQLFDLAESKKKILAVYHNRRYDQDFQIIKEMVRNKTLGDVVTFESHFDRYRPEANLSAWRETTNRQSGIWWDLGPHLIDQALQLFGAPQSIDYDIGHQRSSPANDFFNVTLKYDKGRRAHLRASCLVKDFGFRFRIHGRKGSLLVKKLDQQEGQLRAGKSPLDQDFDLIQSSAIEVSEGITIPHIKSSYLDFYRELYTAIAKNQEFSVTRQDVIAVTAVLLGKKIF